MPATTASRTPAEVIRIARPAVDAPYRSGSLFTGTAALDLAAQELFNTELAWLAEYEPPDKKGRATQGAARLLAHWLPEVPNLGDITAVDWGLVALLAPIDVLTAGWPCQPFSLAGKRKGADDERALWPEVARCVRALRPRYILLENVSACVGSELGRVAATLAEHGYRFAWVCLPASAVGAPHRRLRLFIVATTDSGSQTGDERPGLRAHDPIRVRRPRSPHRRGTSADAASVRRREGGSEAAGVIGGPDAPERGVPAGRDEAVANAGRDAREEDDADVSAPAGRRRAASDADRSVRERDLRDSGPGTVQREVADRDSPGCVDWAGYEPAIRRWEGILGRPAPFPTIVGARGGRALNPALTEWMMGLPDGWITEVPNLSRAAMIKLAGNGVVPRQATVAYRYLLGILDEDARKPHAST